MIYRASPDLMHKLHQCDGTETNVNNDFPAVALNFVNVTEIEVCSYLAPLYSHVCVCVCSMWNYTNTRFYDSVKKWLTSSFLAFVLS